MPATLPITNPFPKDGETKVNIFGYIPWLGLDITAVILFGACLVVHATYAFLEGRKRRRHINVVDEPQDTEVTTNRFRTQSGLITFQILFSIGCAFEVIGYGCRIASTSDPYRLVLFILNYFTIVIVSCYSLIPAPIHSYNLYDYQAPVFFSAALYVCLSIILLQGDCSSLLPISGRKIIASEHYTLLAS
jgi:hypothetical protein